MIPVGNRLATRRCDPALRPGAATAATTPRCALARCDLCPVVLRGASALRCCVASRVSSRLSHVSSRLSHLLASLSHLLACPASPNGPSICRISSGLLAFPGISGVSSRLSRLTCLFHDRRCPCNEFKSSYHNGYT